MSGSLSLSLSKPHCKFKQRRQAFFVGKYKFKVWVGWEGITPVSVCWLLWKWLFSHRQLSLCWTGAAAADSPMPMLPMAGRNAFTWFQHWRYAFTWFIDWRCGCTLTRVQILQLPLYTFVWMLIDYYQRKISTASECLLPTSPLISNQKQWTYGCNVFV